MTTEQKNILICEARGLDFPNHFTSLDAMHEAATTLNNAQKLRYVTLLHTLYKNAEDRFEPDASGEKPCIGWFATEATAAQRAEAFGLTLELWKEGE